MAIVRERFANGGDGNGRALTSPGGVNFRARLESPTDAPNRAVSSPSDAAGERRGQLDAVDSTGTTMIINSTLLPWVFFHCTHISNVILTQPMTNSTAFLPSEVSFILWNAPLLFLQVCGLTLNIIILFHWHYFSSIIRIIDYLSSFAGYKRTMSPSKTVSTVRVTFPLSRMLNQWTNPHDATSAEVGVVYHPHETHAISQARVTAQANDNPAMASQKSHDVSEQQTASTTAPPGSKSESSKSKRGSNRRAGGNYKRRSGGNGGGRGTAGKGINSFPMELHERRSVMLNVLYIPYCMCADDF